MKEGDAPITAHVSSSLGSLDFVCQCQGQIANGSRPLSWLFRVSSFNQNSTHRYVADRENQWQYKAVVEFYIVDWAFAAKDS